MDPARVIYMGNDINDLPCFPLVGCAVVVADAQPAALQGSGYRSQSARRARRRARVMRFIGSKKIILTVLCGDKKQRQPVLIERSRRWNLYSL